ncbi:Aste57867_8722 [Aphanomyces stellatus]|uniref:Aste57867_8722 protein n=1 Tax=Aphanomyces stellatus TaxID=120398 RepID=A0A485KL23_9STRA|nr:hypothetical protein As57867_008688 [Aphanomyces stellatus]VFT85608.1 Aste57867_8722 [Aphanomyces stellatus]
MAFRSSSSSGLRSSSSILPRSPSAAKRHVLQIELHKATGLAAADFSLLGRHNSDPYVIFNVGKERHKSEVIPKCLNPVWKDAVFDFHVTDGDLFTKVLDVQVYDQDKSDDDLLGTVAIPLAQFATQGPDLVRPKAYHLNVPAQYAKQKCVSQLFLTIRLIEAGGDADNSTFYIPRHLKVHLHKASDLAAADFSLLGRGKSDPYVIFSVAEQRFKSATIVKTLDPVWQDTPVFEFDLTQDDLYTQVLDIQVFDSDFGLTADDLIGTLSIPLAQFDDPRDIRMRPYPLAVPDAYRKQNVHSQLYLTIEMDDKPLDVGDMPPPPPEDVSTLMADMQAEIAALKASNRGMVVKMEREIVQATPPPAPAAAPDASAVPASAIHHQQPEPGTPLRLRRSFDAHAAGVENEGDNKKRALVNELHGLLSLPPIQKFTKLTLASTADGETLKWQNEVEHLKEQLSQQKRLNEMLAAQDSGDKDEVERLKHEIALHKATLMATQSMMEEQARREAETRRELLKLQSSGVTSGRTSISIPDAPPAIHEKDDDDEEEGEPEWL